MLKFNNRGDVEPRSQVADANKPLIRDRISPSLRIFPYKKYKMKPYSLWKCLLIEFLMTRHSNSPFDASKFRFCGCKTVVPILESSSFLRSVLIQKAKCIVRTPRTRLSFHRCEVSQSRYMHILLQNFAISAFTTGYYKLAMVLLLEGYSNIRREKRIKIGYYVIVNVDYMKFARSAINEVQLI